MTYNLADLRKAIAAFMTREEASFKKNSEDLLLRAINNAQMYADRRIKFELTRSSAKIAGVSVKNGERLTKAVDFTDTVSPVEIRLLSAAFLKYTNSDTTFPIDIISRDNHIARLKRRYEGIKPVDNVDVGTAMGEFPYALVQVGDRVYVTPADETGLGGSTIDLFLECFMWLPKYTVALSGSATSTGTKELNDTAATFVTTGVAVGDRINNTTDGTWANVTKVDSETKLTLDADIFVSGEKYTGVETSFLLDRCFDYLMYRSVFELNFFLKEDQRVGIASGLMKDVWTSMIAWNTSIINSTVDDVSLD